MPKTVYLSGPIRCVTDDQAFTWRALAEEYLTAKGFRVRVPERKFQSPQNIVRGDLEDIRLSDIILAHVPEGIVAIGTNMEIFHAYYAGKIVVLWGGDFSKETMSAWLSCHCEAFCDMLNEALCFIWKNYSD